MSFNQSRTADMENSMRINEGRDAGTEPEEVNVGLEVVLDIAGVVKFVPGIEPLDWTSDMTA